MTVVRANSLFQPCAERCSSTPVDLRDFLGVREHQVLLAQVVQRDYGI